MRHTTVALAAVLVGLFSASSAIPCSRVLWDSGTGQVFVGRTQDWTEIDFGKLDFDKDKGERELQVEKNIFSLTGDVTNQLQPAKPFVFGMNKK